MFPEKYLPVEGSTYSLFGHRSDTDEYYRQISFLADELITTFGSAAKVLDVTGRYRNSRKKLRRLARTDNRHAMGMILKKLSPVLSGFTENAESYTKSLHWTTRIRDKGLSMTEEQYHCTMLEVELVNRINRLRFSKADRRIALLPHCIRDLSRKCRAEKSGFDQACSGCSKNCYISALTEILRKYNIEPYIWMEGSFRKLFLEMKGQGEVLGILGIACLAELKSGMEKCLKYDIPALGLPLDANRCARWMGEFYPNSVNLSRVEKLLV